MLAFLKLSTSIKPTPTSTPSTLSCDTTACSVLSDTCLCLGQRVRVEGLSKTLHYNGLVARVEVRLEGGWYRLVLQDGKKLSLKADNHTTTSQNYSIYVFHLSILVSM